MILSFSVTNFKSIKDKQTLNLQSEGKNDVHPNNIAYPDEKGKIATLRTVAIYGPNASGKSTICEALETFQSLIENSFSYKEKAPIKKYNPFKLSPETRQAPTRFELEFIFEKIRYIYIIEYNQMEILEESLIRYPRAVKIFTRKHNEVTPCDETVRYGVLPNRSYLSLLGNSNNQKKLEKNICHFICHKIDFFNPQTNISSNMMKHDIFRKAFEILLNCADTGIERIQLKKMNFDVSRVNFPADMPEDIKQKICEEIGMKPVFFHNGSNVEFQLREESLGTQRFLSLLYPLIQNLTKGGILIIDEIDCQLHPNLAEMLIHFYNDPEISKYNAQLIYTTHNTRLMNEDNLRRDQIYLTQKNREGATSLFSLDEYKEVRPTTPFEKWYHDGRFDAIPNLQYDNAKEMLHTLKTPKKEVIDE